MSTVHLHLLLSHVPVIGVAGVAFLLIISLLKRSDELARTALALTVIVAVFAVAVFLTGEGSEDAVERLTGVSEAAIEAHEEAGAVALWTSVGLGVIGLGMLAVFRRRPLPLPVTGAALLLALIVSGIFAWTANLGGQIRHTEITDAGSSIPPVRGEDRRERR